MHINFLDERIVYLICKCFNRNLMEKNVYCCKLRLVNFIINMLQQELFYSILSIRAQAGPVSLKLGNERGLFYRLHNSNQPSLDLLWSWRNTDLVPHPSDCNANKHVISFTCLT